MAHEIKRVKAILWDLDGVLVDSERAWHQVLIRTCQRFGRPMISWEEFHPTFGSGVEADRDRWFPDLGRAELDAFYQEAMQQEVDAIEVVPGAVEVLSQAARQGIRQAVVTNTPVLLAREVLRATGLGGNLQALAAGGEAPDKPSPGLVLLALERLDVAPEEAIFVGDSATDTAAARAAGVRMVGLGTEGDETVTSLEDLSGLLGL